MTGDFYPAGADRETMLDLLGRQVASPCSSSAACTRCTTPVRASSSRSGPKKALHGFVEDVLGEHDDVLALFTNHPKNGDVAVVQRRAVRPVGRRSRATRADRHRPTLAPRQPPSPTSPAVAPRAGHPTPDAERRATDTPTDDP